MRREFLQLAKPYSSKAKRPPKIAGWFISEKLDGTRCFWDGGVTRGLATSTVPWASVIDPKTGSRKAKIKPVSTGLWSRYGNPIMAPDWFLNQLPCCPLDGELWAGRGNFQTCRSICAGDEPDARFDKIVYAVYGCPPVEGIFMTGEIKNTNFHCNIDQIAIMAWCRAQAHNDWDIRSSWSFEEELEYLNDMLDPSSSIYLHPQRKLSTNEEEAKQQVEEYLNSIVQQGGEGVVIRDPKAHYKPKRMSHILKYKPFDDGEARIVGFTSGRKTDKGSKLLGMIGAIIVDYQGKRLELAGLTDEERRFETLEMSNFAKKNPGVDMPSDFQGKYFKTGEIITFKFRELSDDGIPKDARYWRRPMPERAAS